MIYHDSPSKVPGRSRTKVNRKSLRVRIQDMEIPNDPKTGEPNTDFFPSLSWDNGICHTYKGEFKGTEIPKKPEIGECHNTETHTESLSSANRRAITDLER